MRYIGIDFGSKRVGIAISDKDGRLAFPYEVLSNDGELIGKIEQIVKKEGVGQIVIGESRNFKGEPNEIMEDIEKFCQTLRERIGLLAALEPEFMTSVQAERLQGKNKMHDASAAAIILQSYLDRKHSVI